MDWLQERTDPVISQAKDQYPILNNYPIQYSRSNQPGKGFLEFWPQGEIGTADRPRPKDITADSIGVEILNEQTRPIDILGDVVSHHLVNVDPKFKSYYKTFEKSLTKDQQQRLQDQYAHAQVNEGETRPYQDWYKSSGLPGYFRGYAFQQWDNPQEIYTPKQLKMFDDMMTHLKRK